MIKIRILGGYIPPRPTRLGVATRRPQRPGAGRVKITETHVKNWRIQILRWPNGTIAVSLWGPRKKLLISDIELRNQRLPTIPKYVCRELRRLVAAFGIYLPPCDKPKTLKIPRRKWVADQIYRHIIQYVPEPYRKYYYSSLKKIAEKLAKSPIDWQLIDWQSIDWAHPEAALAEINRYIELTDAEILAKVAAAYRRLLSQAPPDSVEIDPEALLYA